MNNMDSICCWFREMILLLYVTDGRYPTAYSTEDKSRGSFYTKKLLVLCSLKLQIYGINLNNKNINIKNLLLLFYRIGGKRTNLSPDGKRLPPPVDIHNIRGVAGFWGVRRGIGGGVRVWASGINTHSMNTHRFSVRLWQTAHTCRSEAFPFFFVNLTQTLKVTYIILYIIPLRKLSKSVTGNRYQF